MTLEAIHEIDSDYILVRVVNRRGYGARSRWRESHPLKTPKQVVTEWAAAFNRQDAAGAAALYHEDATNIQIAEGEPMRGRQAILDSFTSLFRAFPDSYTRVENMFEDGEWSIIEWVGGGTFRGEFAGCAPTGRSFILRGCGFFDVANGKIRFQRGYWDKASSEFRWSRSPHTKE